MSEDDLKAIGVSLFLEFITPEEEALLMSKLNTKTLKGGKSRNTIMRYGSNLPYNSNMISASIPAQYNFAIDRIMERKLTTLRPDSVTVNEYQKGQQITPHIDSPTSGPEILVLSLKSSATMVLNSPDGKTSHKILLPPRCLIQMVGDSRHKWKHSIEPVLELRYSVVFRQGTQRESFPKKVGPASRKKPSK